MKISSLKHLVFQFVQKAVNRRIKVCCHCP